MKKNLGWLLIVLAALVLLCYIVNSNVLWLISNILDIVVFGYAGYISLKTDKIVSWLLILAAVLVIVGLILEKNRLWKVIDVYLAVMGLVGGYVLMKKTAS